MCTAQDLEYIKRIVTYHNGTVTIDGDEGYMIAEINGGREDGLWWRSKDETFEHFLYELHNWSKEQGSRYWN